MWLIKLWKLKDLRNKVLVVLFILGLTRILAHVPIPTLSVADIQQVFSGNQFFGILNIFSGGGLANLSVAMLGLGPYITASIIMQLLTVIVPSLQELQKEGGEAGRAKINKYTNYMTVPLTTLQAFGTITLFSQGGAQFGVLNFPTLSPFEWLITLVAITAGSTILVWLGELITEKGIGNGISLIIFAGIIAYLPQQVQQLIATYDPTQLDIYVAFLAIALVVVGGIVYTNEAQRNIPVSYAKQVRGNRLFGGVSTHLPLRLLQAGVIPIIFAISIMIFPGWLASFFTNAKTEFIATAAQWTIDTLQPGNLTYVISYFLLIVLFTYFYTAIVFNPDEISDNLQKGGGFIPGLRPGRQTADYLYKVLNRVTTAGAIIIGLIAILPFAMQGALSSTVLVVGGTSLLIVVAVVVETIKQIEAQLVMREYEA